MLWLSLWWLPALLWCPGARALSWQRSVSWSSLDSGGAGAAPAPRQAPSWFPRVRLAALLLRRKGLGRQREDLAWHAHRRCSRALRFCNTSFSSYCSSSSSSASSPGDNQKARTPPWRCRSTTSSAVLTSHSPTSRPPPRSRNSVATGLRCLTVPGRRTGTSGSPSSSTRSTNRLCRCPTRPGHLPRNCRGRRPCPPFCSNSASAAQATCSPTPRTHCCTRTLLLGHNWRPCLSCSTRSSSPQTILSHGPTCSRRLRCNPSPRACSTRASAAAPTCGSTSRSSPPAPSCRLRCRSHTRLRSRGRAPRSRPCGRSGGTATNRRFCCSPQMAWSCRRPPCHWAS